MGDPILISVENESDVAAFSSYVSPPPVAVATSAPIVSAPSTPAPKPSAAPTPEVTKVAPPPVVKKELSSPPVPKVSAAPVDSVPQTVPSSEVYFTKWSNSIGNSALGSVLLSKQKAYAEKYGRTGNKLSK